MCVQGTGCGTTTRAERADYVLLMERESGKGYARKDNKWVLLTREGDMVDGGWRQRRSEYRQTTVQEPWGATRCSNTVENDARRIINDIRFRTDQSLRQLEAILTALREIEGPKHVIWISAGLPLDGPGARLQLLARLAAAARVTIHVLMLDQPLVSTTSAEAPPSPRQDRDLLE